MRDQPVVGQYQLLWRWAAAKSERIVMTALLDLAPRDAGIAPSELTVDFLESTTLHEIAACQFTCTHECRMSERSFIPSVDDAI